MASFWDGLLGGSDPSALYGDIFTPQQKQALQYRQMTDTLGELAAGFGRAATPSPVKLGLGAVLGTAAGGLGAGEDRAAQRAMAGVALSEKIREARRAQRLEQIGLPYILAGLEKTYPGVTKAVMGAVGSGAAPAPGTPPGPPGTVPPGPPGAVPPGPPEAVPPVQSLPGIKDLGPPAFGGGGLLAQGPPGGVAAASGMSPEMVALAAGTAGPAWGLPAEPAPPAAPAPAGPGGDWDVTGPGLPPPAGPPKQTGLLPAPDEYIPQGGPGILGGGAIMPASYGGGAGAPLPFRQASSGGGPGAGGADRGRQGRVDFWMSRGAPRHVAEGIADRVNAESGFNPSIMGDSGTSGGLYQHHADRLAGLKRFAAQQGKPWTDPSVQDQFAASEVTGGDATATKGWSEILNAPDRQTAAKLWDRYFERSASGPGSRSPDTVIPSGGPRLTRDMLMNAQYSPGSSAGAPAGGNLDDPIPGLGMSPKEVASLDALATMIGMKTPFKGLLESYYKTPGYLGEIARTETQARKDVELKTDPLIEQEKTRARLQAEIELKPQLQEAIERLQSPILKEREQAKADIDRVTEQLKQAGAAGTKIEEATILGDDGRPTTTKMTALEIAARQDAAAKRRAAGDTTPKPGDIVGLPTNLGPIPPGHEYRMTPQGWQATVIPNTPQAREAEQAAKAADLQKAQAQASTDFVVEDIDRIRQEVEAAPSTTTGVVGGLLAHLDQTGAGGVRNLIEGIEANIMLDRMLQLKAASPTGSTGMGSQTQQEGERLIKSFGSLKQSQGTEQFLHNLERVQRRYLEFIHGPAAAQQMMADKKAAAKAAKENAAGGQAAPTQTAPLTTPYGTITPVR